MRKLHCSLRFMGVLAMSLALAVTTAESTTVQPGDAWATPAERSGFEATPDYDETLAFLARLADAMPELRVEFFGRSAEGREMPVVIVSGDRTFTPQAAAASGKAIVMLQAGIHAGEIDGKDAMLMLLRDLARGAHREILEGVVLLFVPFYNVDGHERVSPFNRPNQNGPVRGMGFRTTTDGHDLNRDHVKLVTPEARALIRLFARWRPHLHVDSHVTDGADHAWELTYSWAEAPQLAPPLHEWMELRMPRVIAATRSRGHRIGPYVSLVDRADPTRGFSSYVGEPRYATGYFPLRNRPSILLEGHAYKPYETRVRVTRDFLQALLEIVAADPEPLIEAVRRAERRTVESGRARALPSSLTLRYRTAEATEVVRLPLYEWRSEESVVTGGPVVRYRSGAERPVEAPWIHVPEAEIVIPRPRGYLVLPGWPVIERRLRDHALIVRRLTAPAELSVRTIRISNPQRLDTPRFSYQGLSRARVETTTADETVAFPIGTLWIPADQPDFELAAQLLEPQAPDSLVAWGMLSIVMERKEYIEPRVLDLLAREMLEQPETAREWREALEDDTFASDGRARYLWWYRRTRHWDPTVGRLPAMRLPEAAELATEPWNPEP